MFQKLFSSTYIKIIIGLIIGFFITQQIILNLEKILGYLTEININLLLLSFFILLLAFFLLPIGMKIFIQLLGENTNYQVCSRAFFLSQPAKYVPGSLWVAPSRVILLKQSGINQNIALLSLVFETILILFSSLLVGVLAFIFIPHISKELQLLLVGGITISLASLLLLFAIPEIGKQFSKKSSRFLMFFEEIAKIQFKTRVWVTVKATGIFLLLWLLVGFSFFLLIQAVEYNADPVLIPITVGVFAFSWAIGFVAIFSPGGIGVREGVMVLLLGSFLPSGLVLTSVLLSRFLWVLAELVFFLFFLLYPNNKKVIDNF